MLKNAKKELCWWLSNIEDVSGFTMKINPTVSSLHFQHIFHGDASEVGMYLGMIRNQAVTLVSEPFQAQRRIKVQHTERFESSGHSK